MYRSLSSPTKYHNNRLRIGIDLGGTKIEAIALAPNGRECERIRARTPKGDYYATVKCIVNLVDMIEHNVGDHGTVGIGIPGAISEQTGLVKNANSTWLIGRPFHHDVSAALRRPVRIANDANCFAMSEARDGAGKGQQLVFGVIIGTGTGGGIVINNQILKGPNSIAGEWGHNSLPWPDDSEIPGPQCYCGKFGCIETFLSGPGLARDYMLYSAKYLTPEEIVIQSAKGNTNALDALNRYERRLAKGLAAIINVLDPDVIVLGGGCSNIERLYQNVPKLWTKYIFSPEISTQLRCNIHGDSSGVRGAAWLWP